MDSIEKNRREMLEKRVWAVVGVTPDPDKYGYKIYKKLKNNGYKVYGVNPKYDRIEGDIIYSSLKTLPEAPQCVSVVVNPKMTKIMLEEIKELAIPYLWFQPGTYDEEIIERAEDYGINIVYHHCVLVELG